MTNFWQELPKPFTILAPMDNVTDNVFRQVVLEAGRPDVFFTEFTNADGLVYVKRGGPHKKLEFTSNQHPIVAQIWGTNVKNMEKAAKLIAKLGFDGIDINMGCPVREVIKKGAGAGMIGNFELTHKIIETVKSGAGKVPVSVKTRLGINENVAESWTTFLLNEGISALTIHARTAKQMSTGDADWEEIKKIVRLRDNIAPKTLIIGNGDVKSYSEIVEKERIYGVDGAMVGRGIFSDPWIFDPKKKEHSREDYINLLKTHIKLFEKEWGETKHFAVIKKFFKIYIKGWSGANSLRIKLMEAGSLGEIKATIAQL